MATRASESSVLPFPRSQRRAAKKRKLPHEDQPRERILSYGGSALSDAELLSCLLLGGARLDSLESAQELICELGGLGGLLLARDRDLMFSGIGPARRAALLAAVELSRRLARVRMPRRDLLDRPGAVASYLSLRYAQSDQEVMGALYLDVRNRLIAEGDIYRGTLSRAAVEPRTIIKYGLLCSASGFILYHYVPGHIMQSLLS